MWCDGESGDCCGIGACLLSLRNVDLRRTERDARCPGYMGVVCLARFTLEYSKVDPLSATFRHPLVEVSVILLCHAVTVGHGDHRVVDERGRSGTPLAGVGYQSSRVDGGTVRAAQALVRPSPCSVGPGTRVQCHSPGSTPQVRAVAGVGRCVRWLLHASCTSM